MLRPRREQNKTIKPLVPCWTEESSLILPLHSAHLLSSLSLCMLLFILTNILFSFPHFVLIPPPLFLVSPPDLPLPWPSQERPRVFISTSDFQFLPRVRFLSDSQRVDSAVDLGTPVGLFCPLGVRTLTLTVVLTPGKIRIIGCWRFLCTTSVKLYLHLKLVAI
jgi:hypothetical protein